MILRGGLSFTALRVRVVNRYGHRASSLRCGMRAAIAWGPAVALLTGATQLERFDHPLMATILAVTTAILYACSALASIFTPSHGVVDRVSGTYLVR